jgi:hypothetical protein
MMTAAVRNKRLMRLVSIVLSIGTLALLSILLLAPCLVIHR